MLQKPKHFLQGRIKNKHTEWNYRGIGNISLNMLATVILLKNFRRIFVLVSLL